MASIDPASQLAGMVRTLLARQKAGPSGKAPPKGAKQQRQASPTADRSERLLNLLAARIRAIPEGDPDRRTKVLRAFLEANLLAEFGEQVANDPDFAQMVDHVQEQMQGQAALADSIDQVVDSLLGKPP